MAHDLTATQARTVSTTDLVIYDEIDVINRAIMADALAGNLNTTVDDGTTMTESTPTITVVSSGLGVFTPNATLTIAGTSVTLGDGGTDGTGIEQATADINNAAIVGLTATEDGTEITLSYEPPMAAWTLTLAEGSGGLAELGFTAGTTSATTPESINYWNVWGGTLTDRKQSYELAQVINHFQGFGYSITAKTNTVTTNTLLWEVYW